MRRRTLIWLTLLLIFFLLFLSIKSVVGQGISYTQAPILLTTLSLIILFTLYLLTSRYRLWSLSADKIVLMGVGTALYLGLAYAFTVVFNISLGKLDLRPEVSLPILFGFAFGPGVGFFTGAVGSLLADFAIGWDVFPIWNVAAGLTGLIPGFIALFEEENIPESYISTVVNLLILTSGLTVILFPRAPEPWTGVIQDYSFWGLILLLAGVVMAANSYLMEQDRLGLISINLWGALGILVSTLSASLADIWVNDFSLATALIGEYVPYAAIDLLNLVIFAPVLMALHQFARNYLPGTARSGRQVP